MSVKYSDNPVEIDTLLIIGSRAKLYQINGTNLSVDEIFIQIFNLSTLPATNDIPTESYLLQPNANFSLGFLGEHGNPGRMFNNGIGVAFSTSSDELNIVAAPAGTIFAVYWEPSL